jgi:hypothetical protein
VRRIVNGVTAGFVAEGAVRRASAQPIFAANNANTCSRLN